MQRFCKVFGGIGRDHHHAFPVVVAVLLFGRELAFMHLDPIFLGDIFQRFGIGHVFVLHDKGNRVAPLATTETFEEPFGWRDNEGWCLFIVKRTAGHIVGATFFQRDEIADYINNVGCCKNSIYGISVNHDGCLRSPKIRIFQKAGIEKSDARKTETGSVDILYRGMLLFEWRENCKSVFCLCSHFQYRGSHPWTGVPKDHVTKGQHCVCCSIKWGCEAGMADLLKPC